MESDNFTVSFLYDQYAHDLYIIQVPAALSCIKKTGRLAAHVRTAATAGLFCQTLPYIVTARLPFIKKRRYFMDAMYSRYSSFVMRGL